MAGRVGHDEFAPVRGKEAVGDVNGDALLALGGQTVEEQCEIQITPLGTDLFRVALERRQLILEDQLRFVEQAADERALAVVDAAAGEESQEALVLVGVKISLDVLGDKIGGVRHQKYPSCFFFSIDPVESWSMTRPSRSHLFPRSISWMMAVSVSASLSMAPVRG